MDWARRNARDAAGLFYNDWSGKKERIGHAQVGPLDEACIPEYFVRAALIRRGSRTGCLAPVGIVSHRTVGNIQELHPEAGDVPVRDVCATG